MSGAPAGTGQLIGQRLGKYEVLALLALGGTAEIYLARIAGTAGFEKYVVVKCLHDHLADDAEFVRMFLDEARLAAQLDHSNIVQTFELGQHQGRYFMAMEFLAGLSLAMVVRRVAERVDSGRIPLPLILNMCAQASAGLQYAHERTNGGQALNVVHRDISPQNLVVSFEGVVKIVDFGIARAEQRETKTRAGTIKGKFAYMSPEQCVSANVDRRTDVFALGIILHELITGRRLFKRANQYDTYQAVIECQVPAPSSLVPGIDAAMDQVVMKALAKDKEARYPSAEAFGDALQRIMHERSMFAGPAEIARFFDANFAQEIDEHGGRMRELIAGRELSAEGTTGVNWDAEISGEEGELSQSEMVLGTEDLSIVDAAPDAEDGAEKTRIEMNPLEQVLAAEAARKEVAAAAPTGPAGGNGATRRLHGPSTPAPLPAPPTGPYSFAPEVDPLARTQERTRPAEVERAIAARDARDQAERDRARSENSQPTVLLDDSALPARAPSSFPEAKTVLGDGTAAPPRAKSQPPELAPTALSSRVVPSDYGSEAPTRGGLPSNHIPSSGELLVPPPSGEVVIPAPGPASGPMGAMSPGGAGPMGPGAPLFERPSGPMNPLSGGPMGGAMGAMNPMGGGPMGAVGPGGYPLASASGGLPLPAHMMSPAPSGYHGGADLGRIAQRPIRRVPPWMLAVIFVGVLVGALVVTIVIARVVR